MYWDSATLHRQYDRYNVRVVRTADAEPITLDEARQHLRIIPVGSPPTSSEDGWIQRNLTAAREWCEGWAMIALAPTTFELGIASFPNGNQYAVYSGYAPTPQAGAAIMLPFGPIAAVNFLAYYDGGGALQTLDASAYYVNAFSRPALLYPEGGTWPTAGARADAVHVNYDAGFSDPGDSPQPRPFPESARAAILLVLGHLYLNRENSAEVTIEEIPLGAKALLERYSARVWIA